MKKHTLTRDVSKKECPWLDNDLKRGSTVYTYDGCTYGVISPSGMAVSFDGNTPFFEIPLDSVTLYRSSDRD